VKKARPKRLVKRKPRGSNGGNGHSKLTKELTDKVCGFIAGGMRWEDACILSGIHRSTAWEWRAKGENGDPTYQYFMEQADLAELKSKAVLVSYIRNDPDWKARKFILINRFPDEFKDRYYQELSGKDGQPIQTNGTFNPFQVNITMSGTNDEEVFTTIDHRNGNGS
jgi:hypothetical protein